MLLQKIRKEKPKKALPVAIDYDNTKYWQIVDDICTYLKIDKPNILFYPFIFDLPEIGQVGSNEISDYKKYGQYMIGGIYYDNTDTILMQYNDPTTGNQYGYPDAYIDNIAHELRHKWQYIYHRDKFYVEPNAIGIEHVNDKSEIDADAFSCAYTTHFLKREGKVYSPFVAGMFMVDGGLRERQFKHILYDEMKHVYKGK